MAIFFLEKRDGGRVGGHWASRFIIQQEKLKIRLNHIYDFQRVTCEDPEFISAWFRLVNNIKAKYGIKDSDLSNFDKTGFIMGVIYSSSLVIIRVD